MTGLGRAGITAGLLSLAACAGFGEEIEVEVEGERAFLSGVIGSDALSQVQDALAGHPEVQVLVLGDMPGSADDEANLQLARWVRAQGYDTELTASSQIASGAVDLFVAGVTRTGHCSAEVGVHSWSDGNGLEATDLPRDHGDHQLYLDYYAEMDVPAEFYWFTIQAAPAADIYVMAAAELNEYAVVTEPLTCP